MDEKEIGNILTEVAVGYFSKMPLFPRPADVRSAVFDYTCKAAHAIAERMKAGVVWEGDGNNRDGWPWIDSNKGRTDLAEAFKKLEDGQAFHVVFTVIKLEGEDGQG